MTYAFRAAHRRAALPWALWLLAGAPAAAQTVAADRAADPRADVPATRYTPAFSRPTEAPPAGTPDRNWHASNAAVAGGHTMAMPAMTMPAAGAMQAPTQTPVPHAHGHDHHAGMAMPPAPAREER